MRRSRACWRRTISVTRGRTTPSSCTSDRWSQPDRRSAVCSRSFPAGGGPHNLFQGLSLGAVGPEARPYALLFLPVTRLRVACSIGRVFQCPDVIDRAAPSKLRLALARCRRALCEERPSRMHSACGRRTLTTDESPHQTHQVWCVEDNMPTWLCELMVEKPTVEDAIAAAKAVEGQLRVPITPRK